MVESLSPSRCAPRPHAARCPSVAGLNQSPPAALQPIPPCVCISPLPASAGQPLPAQAPVPRPVLPESCGAGESRTAGAAGGGKGRLIFLYLYLPIAAPTRSRNAQTVTSLDAHIEFRWQPTAPVTVRQRIFTAFGRRTAGEAVGL